MYVQWSSYALDTNYHLVVQVQRICPQVLLPVLPHLKAELGCRDEARRSAATGTVGCMLATLGSDLEGRYDDLLEAFLQRCFDNKVKQAWTCLLPCVDCEATSMYRLSIAWPHARGTASRKCAGKLDLLLIGGFNTDA